MFFGFLRFPADIGFFSASDVMQFPDSKLRSLMVVASSTAGRAVCTPVQVRPGRDEPGEHPGPAIGNVAPWWKAAAYAGVLHW